MNNDPPTPLTDLWTPNGGRVLVQATPTPTPQNGDDTLAAAGPALPAEPLTPMVIEDTLDQQAIAPFILGSQMLDQQEATAANVQTQQNADNEARALALVAQQLVRATPAQAMSAFQQLHVPLHIATGQYATPVLQMQQPAPPTVRSPLGKLDINVGHPRDASRHAGVDAQGLANDEHDVPPPVSSMLSNTPLRAAVSSTRATTSNGSTRASFERFSAHHPLSSRLLPPRTLLTRSTPAAQPEAFEFPPPGHVTSGWDTTPAHSDAPSSSPISFDLDSPTPTGRFARARIMAQGRQHETTVLPQTPAAGLLLFSTARIRSRSTDNWDGHAGGTMLTAAGAPAANEVEHVATTGGADGHLQHQANVSSGDTRLPVSREGTIDYFGFFTTPPPLGEQSVTNETQALEIGNAQQLINATSTSYTIANATLATTDAANANATAASTAAATVPVATTAQNAPDAPVNPSSGQNANGTVPTRHGELLCPLPILDNPPSARKRIWSGSPNLEDMQRSLRRPRRMEPSSGYAARPSAPSGASNPWRSERRATRVGREVLGQGMVSGILFTPVAASTPPPRTVQNTDNRTRLGQLSFLRGAASTTLDDEAHDRTRHISARPNTATVPQIERAPVLTDPHPPTAATAPLALAPPSSAPQRKDKGKKRAVAQESEHDASGDEHAAPEDPEEGWDESHILEARLQSRRQAEIDRTRRYYARHYETAQEAGPSHHAGRYRSAVLDVSEARVGEMRDASSSHLSTREGALSGFDEGRAGERAHYGHAARTRELSSFHPLPNTRAAEHLAGMERDRHLATPPLTQRPTLSRDDYSWHHRRARSSNSSRRDQPERAGYQQEGDWLRGEEASRRMSVCRDEDDEDEDASDPEEEHEEWQEDGEIVPTALDTDEGMLDDSPTEAPRGGFPRIHRDDPESATRGMATEWIREVWADPPNTDVLLEVYNYRYSDDVEFTRRVADLLRWAFDRISDGESEFDVVPPEPAEGVGRRSRDQPTIWAIRGLSPRTVARAVARGVWSFRLISFIALPRILTLPSWLFMLEGYLTGNIDKIRLAVLRVLREPEMREWIAEMTSTNPDFAGLSSDAAFEAILDSLRIDTFQLSNGNYIANVHITRSPTRSMKIWRRWVATLRARRYPSFAIGTGRVRYIAPCGGCRGVNHLSHLCPYPRVRGWNGPAPGEGVFRDRNRNEDESDATVIRGGRYTDRRRDFEGGRREHAPECARRNDRTNARRGPTGPRPGAGPNRDSSRSSNAHGNPYSNSNRRNYRDTRGGKGAGRDHGDRRRY